MDRPARVPLALLVAATALAVLTGVAAVAAAVRGDEPEPRAPAMGEATGGVVSAADRPGVDVEAVRVLRMWDSRRARAYARGDVAALTELYVRGSRTGAADRAVLRAYRERGLRVTGMRTRIIEARVLRATDARISLVVTDVLLDAVAVRRGRDGGWPLPRDGPTTRRVVLVRDHGWRVAEAYVEP